MGRAQEMTTLALRESASMYIVIWLQSHQL